MAQDFGSQWHELQLGTVDAEIARLACICDIRILDRGIIDRIVAGDIDVCGRKSDDAFRKLRALVGMHFSLAADSIQSIGPEESEKILARIREHLRKRYDIGGQEPP